MLFRPQGRIRPQSTVLNRSHPFVHGLVGLWVLGRDGRENIRDHHNRNNATVANDPVRTIGQLGPCLRLSSGSSQYATAPDRNCFDFTSGLTLSVLYTPRSTTTRNALCGKGAAFSSAAHSYYLEQNASGIILFQTRDSSGNEYRITATDLAVSSSKTHMVTGTWDGVTQKCYLDGVQSTVTVNWSGALNTNSNNFSIGRHGDITVAYSSGDFYAAYLWSKALTPGQVAHLSHNPWCMFSHRTMPGLLNTNTTPPSASGRGSFMIL